MKIFQNFRNPTPLNINSMTFESEIDSQDSHDHPETHSTEPVGCPPPGPESRTRCPCKHRAIDRRGQVSLWRGRIGQQPRTLPRGDLRAWRAIGGAGGGTDLRSFRRVTRKLQRDRVLDLLWGYLWGDIGKKLRKAA